MARKKKEEKNLELDFEEKSLTYSYIFLLIASIIFFVSLQNFNFYIFNIETTYSIFVLPFILFLVDAIEKEVGYKSSIVALIISTVFMFFTSVTLDIIFNVDFDIIKNISLTVIYFIAQFINLHIYTYMIDNYKTPFILVLFNFIFAILIYNLLYMLFTLGMFFSTDFWQIYMIVVIIESILSIVVTFLLSLIKQGI